MNIYLLIPKIFAAVLSAPYHLYSSNYMADITTGSLGMLKSVVNRLHQIVENYDYKVRNQLSCLTLDCEHFHASQHFKSVTMSMQHYCMQFGTT